MHRAGPVGVVCVPREQRRGRHAGSSHGCSPRQGQTTGDPEEGFERFGWCESVFCHSAGFNKSLWVRGTQMLPHSWYKSLSLQDSTRSVLLSSVSSWLFHTDSVFPIQLPWYQSQPGRKGVFRTIGLTWEEDFSKSVQDTDVPVKEGHHPCEMLSAVEGPQVSPAPA